MQSNLMKLHTHTFWPFSGIS